MNLWVRLGTVLAILFIGPVTAWACFCADSGPPCEMAWKADVVFAGTVLSITEPPVPTVTGGSSIGRQLQSAPPQPTPFRKRTVRVQVAEALKGIAPGQAEIEIVTGLVAAIVVTTSKPALHMSSTDTEHRKALMSVFARARDRWQMLPKTLHTCALYRRYRTLESFTSLQVHRFARHYRECGQPSMAKGAKPLHQPLFDPDVIRRFEQTATVLNVGASANVTIEPKLAPIPSR